MAFEPTKATLEERDRMKHIKTDADIIAALDRFDLWQNNQALHQNHGNNAVNQMLIFMRRCLDRKISLREALFNRMEKMLLEMCEDAAMVDERLSYAANYVAKNLIHHRSEINYDMKYYYMMNFISRSHNYYDHPKASSVRANFNSIFKLTNLDKILYIFYLARPDRESRYSEDDVISTKIDGERLMEVAVLRDYYNISYHNNNMGGISSWEDGEEIALGIYRFIQDVKSRGLLCSFYPPTGPDKVDWSKNKWVYDPDHWGWIYFSEPTYCLSVFDKIAASPSVWQ